LGAIMMYPTSPRLQDAFRLCAEITRQHSKSFFFSSAFLPREKRVAIRAFYAFCRTTDDMVDQAGQRSPEALARWREASRLPADQQSDPVLFAWATIRDHYQVPQRYVEALIDGCEMDLSVTRYKTWEELRHYCYCVASTVGLVSMHIIGVRSGVTFEQAAPYAIALGEAMQLTNILRDVGEDWARGRVYLPLEDLNRFGYTERDLEQHTVTPGFKQLMRFEMDRADALYDEGSRGIAQLNPEGRFAVAAAGRLYRGILGKIHLNDYDVYRHRAHLTRGDKVRQLPGIYMQVRRLNIES
jgi:15-cis-phytoene synthase